MEFKLFGSSGGSDQIGSTISNVPVTATDGVFTTRLDFGANAFPGADRFLEIAVKKNAGDPYTTLNPRQQLASSPYAVRTLSAQVADVALDSDKLGGLPASDYVTTASVGSAFVKNSTEQQTANFNISGNGFVGGNFAVGTFAPAHRLAVGPTGPPWTGDAWLGSVELPNVGAIGWRSNTSQQSFGIGQTNWGLSFFRTQAPLGGGFPGPVPNYVMNIDNSGNVGIGTTTPANKLDVVGGIRSTSSSLNTIQVETTGSNTAAIFGMVTPSRSWLLGTTHNTLNNQFYLADGFDPRITVQPNGGTIALRANTGFAMFADGGVGQAMPFYGVPKAMLEIMPNGLANATIVKCYNGTTNSTTGNCGFTVNQAGGAGPIAVVFPFRVVERFFVLTQQNASVFDHNLTMAGFDPTDLNGRTAYVFLQNETTNPGFSFFLIVY
jgi:hypothetical protein